MIPLVYQSLRQKALNKGEEVMPEHRFGLKPMESVSQNQYQASSGK
ncbi:hypothetical protein [Enterobacter hormaechei]|nr:hypothetical protein [Enterobacter hormaechei]